MRPILVLAALTATVMGGGCGNDDGARAGSGGERAAFRKTVTISDSRYHPAHTQVLIGGSVTWVNQDPVVNHTAETVSPRYRHTTGGERADFDTHALTWKEPYTVTFHKPGTYTYYCSFHSEMKGEVEVVVRTPPQ